LSGRISQHSFVTFVYTAKKGWSLLDCSHLPCSFNEAYGRRLNLPSGSAVRFEPGDSKAANTAILCKKHIDNLFHFFDFLFFDPFLEFV